MRFKLIGIVQRSESSYLQRQCECGDIDTILRWELATNRYICINCKTFCYFNKEEKDEIKKFIKLQKLIDKFND